MPALLPPLATLAALSPYPSLDVESPDRLLNLLGDFWSTLYGGRPALAALLAARGSLARQTLLRLAECWQATSRLSCPVWERRRWLPWTLRKSEGLAVVPVYGPDRTRGGGLLYGGSGAAALELYGRPSAAGPRRYPAPPGLVQVGALTGGIATPGVLWLQDLDFTLVTEGGVLYFDFLRDPFLEPAFPVELLGDPAAANYPEDALLSVWLSNSQQDTAFFQAQWGYTLGRDGAPSTPAARDAFNALFDALVGGSTTAQLENALSALTGVPLAAGTEVVELLRLWNGRLWLLTDRTAYSFAPGCVPLVQPGQTVTAGQPLTDGLQLFESNQGGVPPGWTTLTLDGALLPGTGLGAISFPNAERAWEGTLDATGRLRLSCALGGHPFDVSAFWDLVHARGLVAGKTLAETLDRRSPGTGPPVALGDVPPTVNPFAFLCANFLAQQTLFVRILGSASQGRSLFADSLLRQLVPPEVLLLVLVVLPPVVERVGPPAGSAVFLDALEPVGGRIQLPATTTWSALRPVSGRCQ